ncbi:MAG TPA: N-acetylglucosamine-6-phosphate deacetylase [Acidobacteriaceae bacterium]
MKIVLTAARLVTGDASIDEPVVVIEDGRIESIASRAGAALPPGEHHAYQGALLAPAYFDVHTHGCCGRDVMEATGEGLGQIGQFLAGHGVGSYLPTTMTAPVDTMLRSLEGLAALIQQRTRLPGAQPVGIHVEGPFLSHVKKGAHPPQHLLAPNVAFFDRMWQAAEGSIRLMTIAPELPGALEVIARATSLGVRVSLGHSNATLAEAERGVAGGAVSATHTFNAMRPFDQREPGILGAVLSDDRLYAELICDGLHVHPSAVRLFWKAKGSERAILITDAMSAAGMPDGVYKLGELDVRVEGGRCLVGENTLAGSTLTLDAAVSNFVQSSGASLEQAVQLASRNPARMAGLPTGRAAGLQVGAAADVVVLSPAGTVIETWLGGRLAAEKS